MTISDPKADLLSYLQGARGAILWKLDGLTEYDARRPLTPTGTNLLGLVKHLARGEFGYFGETFGRPSDAVAPWPEDEQAFEAWALPTESRESIIVCIARPGRTRMRRSRRCRSTRSGRCRGGAMMRK